MTLRIDRLAAAAATTIVTVSILTFVTHAPALWRDEVSSVNTQAGTTWAAMWSKAQFESFPPLWMLLLRGWIATGDFARSDQGLRLFGAMGMAALAAAIWLAARRLAIGVPLISLALVAVNPEIVRWSSTIRPWGIGAALALLSLAMLWRACESASWRSLALAAGVAIASVQCLFQNAILLGAAVAGCLAVAWLARDARRAYAAAGVGLAAALSLLPDWDLISRRAQWNALGSGRSRLGALAMHLSDTAAASGPAAAIVWIVLSVGAVALAARVVMSIRRAAISGQRIDIAERERTAVFLAVTMTTAVAAMLVFYRLLGYQTQSWYYLGLLSVCAVCAEGVLVCLAGSAVINRALSVVALVVLAVGVTGEEEALRQPQTNLDAVGSLLGSRASGHDVVLVNPWFLAVTAARYYRGPADLESVPPMDDHSISRYDLLAAAMEMPNALEPLLSRLRAALSSGHRVWIVGGLQPPADGAVPPRLPRPPLPVTGWNATPYETAWALEAGAFLRDHSVRHERLDVPPGGPLESAGLLMCEGWR